MLELYRERHSLIHTMDARVKILFTLAFILTLNLTPAAAWPAYLLYLSMILSITILSRLGWMYVLKRSLLALPFVLSAIPLIFWGPQPFIQMNIGEVFSVPISSTGLARCISIMIKAWLSIQAAILLTGTTSFIKVMSGFRKLGIPKMLIAIVELMWRYLFILVDEVIRLIRARNSRSSVFNGNHHAGGSILWRGKVTGNMAGSLFLRSIERSERVYDAMLSRGYNGEPMDEPYPGFSSADRWLLAGLLLILFFIYFIGLLTGR